MPIRKHPGARLLMVFLFALCCGCGSKTGEERTAATGDHGGVVAKPVKTARKPQRPKPKPDEPPKIPTIILSKEFKEQCRVFQDQQMPDAELADLEGNNKTLKSLYGRKLTVICLWSVGAAKGPQLLGLKQMLSDLAAIAGKFETPDVRMLGVNVKDAPDVAGKLLKEANVAFENLLDPQGVFFDKVGTDALPRVYLLDAQGKILWFDLLQVTSFDSNLRQLEFCIGIALKQE